jgi:hypothetical protein
MSNRAECVATIVSTFKTGWLCEKKQMVNYRFQTGELRNRTNSHVDHIIELQLVAAALNKLPNNTYNNDSISNLITFFNDIWNLTIRSADQNRVKKRSIGRLIRGLPTDDIDNYWIEVVRNCWRRNRANLKEFALFKEQMRIILNMRN